MSRTAFYSVAAVVIVSLLILLRPMRTTRSNFVEVTERQVDGHAEFSTRWIPLTGYKRRHMEAVEWSAQINADPTKPKFVFSMRNSRPTRDGWEVEAKQPAAIVVEGNRHELKPYQAGVGPDGETVSLVRWGGPRSILAAVAGATSAQLEFGGMRYELNVRGLANFRELLKRSNEKAGQRE